MNIYIYISARKATFGSVWAYKKILKKLPNGPTNQPADDERIRGVTGKLCFQNLEAGD